MRTKIRKIVEQFPALANFYRELRKRGERKKLKVKATPYGISILGGNYLAADAQEGAEIAIFEEQLKDIDTLIDVGANSGVYTCLAASRGKQVISIEPSQDNLAIFFENLRLNGLEDRVEIYPVAVAERIGAIALYGVGQGASLIPGWGGQHHRANIVPVNTIDNIVGGRDLGERIFLKMDVEGAEFEVLAGAAETLARCNQVLIEISLTRNHPSGTNPRFAQTFDILWKHGFEAYSIDPSPALVTADTVQNWIKARRTNQSSENFWFIKAPRDRGSIGS